MEAEDLREILALLANYGATLDEGRFEDHIALYDETCLLNVFGRVIEGRDAIDRFMREARTGKHVTGVPSLVFDGDTAKGNADFLFYQSDMQLFSAGGYRDEFVKTAAGWRIRSRTIDISMRAEN